MILDPIGDMLARIKNATQRNHATVAIPLSKMKLSIAEVLKIEGYIEKYEFYEKDNKGEIIITLKYVNGRSPIRTLKRSSRPGVRKYVAVDRIPTVLQGMGIAILSTSKGVMSGHKAKKLKVGGELLCVVS